MIKSTEQEITIALYKSKVPEHMHKAICRYAMYGTRPGPFLRAIFSNNLLYSCRNADDVNRTKIHIFVFFLHNHMHHDMYGSLEKMRKWIEVGGLIGLENLVAKRMEEKLKEEKKEVEEVTS